MNKKLRIAQIFRAPMGGLFRHVRDLTTELDNRGHEIALICAVPPNDFEKQRLTDLSENCKLGIYEFPMGRMPSIKDGLTGYKIRKIAKEQKLDILHGHGAKGGLFSRIGAHNIPAFYTPHGGILHYSPKKPLGAIFWQIEKLLLKKTSRIIFESQFAERKFTSILKNSHYETEIIHNGISKAETSPVHTQNQPQYDWIFLGELRSLKGIDIFLKALAELKNNHLLKEKALIVGAGPDAKTYVDMAQNLGLTDYVDFEEPQPAREAFAKAKYLIMPSRNESLPYVLLEAIGAGLPVIASNVGGIGEIMLENDPYLFTSEDVNQLSSLMAQMLDNDAEAIETSEKRLEKISTEFSIETMVDQIEQIYFDRLGS